MASIQEVKDIFNELDIDKSGFLELNEIDELCRRANMGIFAASAKKDFQELDINNDQKVSLYEFLSWYKFAKHDKLNSYLKKAISINRE